MTTFKVGDVVYVKEEKWGISGPNVIELFMIHNATVYYKLPISNNWWKASELVHNEPIRNYDETNKLAIDLDKARSIASELAEKYLQKYQDSAPVDVVNAPSHYMIIGNTEAKDLINVMLEQYVKDTPTATPYQIFCAGNVFKYRLRAGSKDSVTQEIDKAKKYKEMHDIINSRT